VVIPGEANDKNIVIEKGLHPRQLVYLIQPENADNFRLVGEELKSFFNERATARK
jgi:hypothetical protein